MRFHFATGFEASAAIFVELKFGPQSTLSPRFRIKNRFGEFPFPHMESQQQVPDQKMFTTPKTRPSYFCAMLKLTWHEMVSWNILDSMKYLWLCSFPLPFALPSPFTVGTVVRDRGGFGAVQALLRNSQTSLCYQHSFDQKPKPQHSMS